MDIEKKICTPSLTAKRLKLQAAEKIAYQIVCNIVPALSKCLYSPDVLSDDILVISSTEYLQKVKFLYWKRGGSLLEPYRSFVSNAVTNIMEVQSQVKNSPVDVCKDLMNKMNRRDLALMSLAIQVLLTYEAGCSNFLNMLKCCVIQGKRCAAFNGLLEALAPFNLRKISTVCLQFQESVPISTLMKHSPYLKHIELVNNNSYLTLDNLKRYGKNIESVYLKLFPYHITSSEGLLPRDFLFRTFFGNSSMAFVIQHMDNRDILDFTFPHLKEVILDNNINTKLPIPVNEFVFCLQHVYPNIRIKWNHFVDIHLPSLHRYQSDFELPLPFKGRDRYKWDVVEVRASKNMKVPLSQNREDAEVGTYTPVNQIVYESDEKLDAQSSLFIEDLIKRHGCDSVGLVLYHSCLNITDLYPVMSAFHNIGKNIRKLFLHMPFGVKRNALIKALNACPLLENFYIKADERIQISSPEPLNILSKMKYLAIHMQLEEPREHEHGYFLKEKLIVAAPHLDTIDLSVISGVELQRLIDLGPGQFSEIKTLQMSYPFPRNFKSFLLSLPSLSVLKLNFRHCIERLSEAFFYEFKREFNYSDLEIICVNTF